MSRRPLPGADELFGSAAPDQPLPDVRSTPLDSKPEITTLMPRFIQTSTQRLAARTRVSSPETTGRERHGEKITVYVSAAELVDLEAARLVLRAEHGIAVDRGRIVREAVAVVLADLEASGESSILIRRLREST